MVVDAHSKWLEVKIVNNAATDSTTNHLCSLFAIHGLPEIIVTMALFLLLLNLRISAGIN